MNRDGRIQLDRSMLKALRKREGLSQELLAEQCRRQGLSLSIATIKRAECGKPVLYRSLRELARYYRLEVEQLLPEGAAGGTPFSA